MAKTKILGTVMVRPGAKTTFRRAVRNKKGEIVRKIEFPPGMPVDLLSKADLEAIYRDIGNALVIVERNEMGQAKPDWDATQEVIRERNGESPEVEIDDLSDGETGGDESVADSIEGPASDDAANSESESNTDAKNSPA